MTKLKFIEDSIAPILKERHRAQERKLNNYDNTEPAFNFSKSTREQEDENHPLVIKARARAALANKDLT